MAKGSVAAPIRDDPVLTAPTILSDVSIIVEADAAIGPDPDAVAEVTEAPVKALAVTIPPPEAAAVVEAIVAPEDVVPTPAVADTPEPTAVDITPFGSKAEAAPRTAPPDTATIVKLF